MPAPASLSHARSNLLSHSLLSHTTSSNSSHGRPFSWNTAAKLSSRCLALTHRHSSPRCSPAAVPASSDQRAGSRAFVVLVPLLPTHPDRADPLASHSATVFYICVGQGREGDSQTRTSPRSHRLLPSREVSSFPAPPPPPSSPESLTMRGRGDCSSSAAFRGFLPWCTLKLSRLFFSASCNFAVLESAVSSSSVFRASALSQDSWDFAILKHSLCLSFQS